MIIFTPLLHAQAPGTEDGPSIELLEFLGAWESSSGEWIDPALMEDKDFTKLLILTDEESNPGARRQGDDDE